MGTFCFSTTPATPNNHRWQCESTQQQRIIFSLFIIMGSIINKVFTPFEFCGRIRWICKYQFLPSPFYYYSRPSDKAKLRVVTTFQDTDRLWNIITCYILSQKITTLNFRLHLVSGCTIRLRQLSWESGWTKSNVYSRILKWFKIYQWRLHYWVCVCDCEIYIYIYIYIYI